MHHSSSSLYYYFWLYLCWPLKSNNCKKCQWICTSTFICARACMNLSSLLRVYIIPSHKQWSPSTCWHTLLLQENQVQAVIFFLLRLCLVPFSFLPPSLSFASYLSTGVLSSSILALLLALAVMRNGHLLQALLSLHVPGKLLLWAHAVLAALVLLAPLLASCFIKFFLISPV